MNPYQAYVETKKSSALTRVDTILALYEGAIRCVESARDALQQNNAFKAYPLLMDGQLYVSGLAAGLDLDRLDATADLLRLFEFVAHSIQLGTPDKLEAAAKVLKNLRDGYQQIRPEAIQLERSGAIPPIDSAPMVRATA